MKSEQLQPETENRLNNELLNAEPAEEKSKPDKKPKRNGRPHEENPSGGREVPSILTRSSGG